MSKKSQFLKDLSVENTGINSFENSLVNFISQCRLFKIRDFKVGLEEFSLPVCELSDKSGNQVYLKELARMTGFKNINHSIQSHYSNIGLLLLFIVYDALNTPILSL